MDIQDKMKTVDDVIKYLFNVGSWDIFEAVYGANHAPAYRDEKARLIERGLSHLWPQLDSDHRARLIEAATERYSNPRYVDLGIDDASLGIPWETQDAGGANSSTE